MKVRILCAITCAIATSVGAQLAPKALRPSAKAQYCITIPAVPPITFTPTRVCLD